MAFRFVVSFRQVNFLRMLRLAPFVFFLLCGFAESAAQPSPINLTRILKRNDLAGIREELRPYIEQHAGSAEALYLEAFSEPDARLAVEKYNRLLNAFPKSEYAAAAYFRIGQYNFAQGLYISARKYFLELLEKFPDSEFADRSMYLAAACMNASKKYDTSYAELRNFLKRFPHSPLTRVAKEDLKEIRSYSAGELAAVNSRLLTSKGKYTLQIGAFSRINNALNLRNYLANLGFPVELREKSEGGRTTYLVWLGSFASKQDAEQFGRKFKNEHGKPYRVVEK